MNVAGHAVKQHRTRFRAINVVRLLAVLLLGCTFSSALAESAPSAVHEVNTVYLTDWAVVQPAALSFSPQYGYFYIVDQASQRAELLVVTPDEEVISKVALPDSASGTQNVAVDRAGNRLFVLDSMLTGLVQIQLGEDGVPDPASAVRHDISRLGLASANGMTMHADGQALLILDSKSSKVISLYLEDQEEQADVAEVSLPAELTGADLRGLATDPETGNLFVLNGFAQRLYELAPTGELVKEYDVSGLELKSPQGIVLAPSVDSTDEPETIHLFVVDSGKVPSPPTQTGGGRLFIPFVPGFHSQGVLQAQAPAAPVSKFVEASLEETIPAPVGVAATPLTYVQTVETSQFSPPSPDASGITYIPNAQVLLITDGEVEEMSIYAGANIFGVRLSNVRVNVPEYTYTTLPYKSTEPTDAAFNPNNGYIFYSDDDAKKIFEVNPGTDGRHGTSDDIVRSFSTSTFGSGDPEGLSYDPATGALFIADGKDNEVYRLSPGPNGVFNGIASGSDDTWSSIDTGVHGIEDPEGVHYEPSTGNLIVTGKSNVLIYELTTTGNLVQTYDVSAATGARKLAGVVQAPSSRDPNKSSFYIVDRMVDNGSNPNENDGRMYEFELTSQQPPTVFVRFTASSYSVSESGGSATINVGLSQSSSQVVTVNYSTANGTAAAGSDYTAASGTLTFSPGETSKSFSVPIANDTLDEPNETVSLSLSSPSNATLGNPSSATLTITDNDAAPTVQFSSATYTVDEGGGNATITVNLSAASGQEVKVNYATANGTATSGSDYTAASGSLTFAAGETSKSFSVSIANDTLDEPNETVSLSLSSPNNATLGSVSSATLTITDNDSAPTVQFNSATYSIGENGGDATVTAILSAASAQVVTVEYATADGTATAGTDYTAAGGTLTFAAGETSKSFTVPITNDTLDEANETVALSLSNPSNATLGSASSATLTITDNDPAPTVQFSSATYTGGEDGGSATITVNLNVPSGRTVSVNYATADGTAQAGNDYNAASGTLTFSPGETSKSFSITIKPDALNEASETVTLSLSSPSNATLGSVSSATLTITDVSPPPTVQFSSATYSIAENGGNATITVILSGASGQPVSVQYATADGTATAGNDYTAATSTLSFAPGETSKTFQIPITDDTRDEPDETVSLSLSNPSNATLGNPSNATLTITDNEGAPTVQFSSATYGVAENGGTATITVNLSPVSGQTVSVNYATADGTAQAGSDYTAASGTLNFAAGEISKSFTVPIANDTQDEPDETVNLTLSGAVNATLGGTSAATLTIADDDEPSPPPPPSGDVIFLSTTGGGTVGNVTVRDEDIVAYETGSGTWTMYFDGSDVGLGATDLSDFVLLQDGTLLLSFNTQISIGALGLVDPTDIVQFIPDPGGLGANTAGRFEWYFDGSDVGLADNSNEGLDAIALTGSGKLILSTVGSFSIPGLSGKDEDMLLFTPTQLGATTSGSFEMYFDGSDVGLSDTGYEDINGTWLQADKVYLTVRGAFSVSGVSGDGGDVFICEPIAVGATTNCTYRPYWDGSANGFGSLIADGVEVDPDGQVFSSAVLELHDVVDLGGPDEEPDVEEDFVDPDDTGDDLKLFIPFVN